MKKIVMLLLTILLANFNSNYALAWGAGPGTTSTTTTAPTTTTTAPTTTTTAPTTTTTAPTVTTTVIPAQTETPRTKICVCFCTDNGFNYTNLGDECVDDTNCSNNSGGGCDGKCGNGTFLNGKCF